MAWIIFYRRAYLRTSGHVLSLAAMFLRQAFYCYFGISLSDVHTPKRVINPLYSQINVLILATHNEK